MPMGYEWIPAILIAIIGAGIDLRRRIIPNWLTLSGFFGGLAWHLLLPEGQGILFASSGAAFASLFFLIPFLRGGIGGGDFKLFLALGAFLGPANGIRIAIAAAIIGGLMAAAFLLVRKNSGRSSEPTEISSTLPGEISENDSPSVRKVKDWGAIPYGPAIALGTAVVIIAS
jgi:prepilin peptidase CpaA